MCWPGYERVDGDCQLTACAAGSALVFTANAASCQCAAGFEFQSTLANGSVVCAACADGLFKDFIGNAPMTKVGSMSSGTCTYEARAECVRSQDE